jgi:ATP-dependent DNA helicase RecG
MILPVYPLTADLSQNFLRKAVKGAIETYGKHEKNYLPPSVIKENKLLEKNEALLNVHFPESEELLIKARKTLKYEELYRFQETIIKSRMEREEKKRPIRKLPDTFQKKIINSLPFELTSDQKIVIDEIYSNSVSDTRMSRIIQGDTGCGKTLAGLLAALPYIEAGYQAAFMAPTELLAKQHSRNAAELLSGTGINIAFLSGKIPQAKKKLLLESLETGEVNLIIGTHALLSSPVKFKNLALAIVDEEHKFGVNQRELLFSKGKDIDTIMMSATPIPRTLEITMMGDMDISTIRSMPAGRMPVNTHSAYSENMQKVYDWVKRELDSGFQAYFVYPLIEESEKLELRDAESMFTEISQKVFPGYKCALIHSRLGEDEKEKTMEMFSAGEVQVLVATSVVEVGVDVKKATCMVIEHSERFGLSLKLLIFLRIKI